MGEAERDRQQKARAKVAERWAVAALRLSGYNNSFPFVDFGNEYVIDGASYDPALPANLSWGQVAADLSNPSSTVGQAIDATANRITAAICTMTGSKPGDVCTSTAVISASGSI
jgi:hypothetical protein